MGTKLELGTRSVGLLDGSSQKLEAQRLTRFELIKFVASTGRAEKGAACDWANVGLTGGFQSCR